MRGHIDLGFGKIGNPEAIMFVYDDVPYNRRGLSRRARRTVYISIDYGYPQDFDNFGLICAGISHETLHLTLDGVLHEPMASFCLDGDCVTGNIDYSGVSRLLIAKAVIGKPRV